MRFYLWVMIVVVSLSFFTHLLRVANFKVAYSTARQSMLDLVLDVVILVWTAILLSKI